MKGPTYIIKRVYLERNAEKEYKGHMKRLERIKSQPSKFLKTVKSINHELNKAQRNHLKATQHKEEEKNREEKVQNKALINKLLEINDGRFSLFRNTSEGNLATMTFGSKNLSATNKNSLNSIGRKLQELKIQQENQALAQRMIQLPPVVSKSKQIIDYQKQAYIKERIQRFHQLKDKQEKNVKVELPDEIQDPFDVNDKELMEQKVLVIVTLQNIDFISFIPQTDDEDEKYFIEIKASVKPLRRTQPDMFDEFSKSIINEYFTLEQLKQSKLMYIGLWQLKTSNVGKKSRENQLQRFLGDFELDLRPYYLEDGEHQVKYDLRNYKEMRTKPNYMHKDMRKKGVIEFELQVKSSIKDFCISSKRCDAEKMEELQNFYRQQYKIAKGEQEKNQDGDYEDAEQKPAISKEPTQRSLKQSRPSQEQSKQQAEEQARQLANDDQKQEPQASEQQPALQQKSDAAQNSQAQPQQTSQPQSNPPNN